MDTKWKNDDGTQVALTEEKSQRVRAVIHQGKGLLAWVVFFMGINLLVAALLLAAVGANAVSPITQVPTVLLSDNVREQPAFKAQMAAYFEAVIATVAGDHERISRIQRAYEGAPMGFAEQSTIHVAVTTVDSAAEAMPDAALAAQNHASQWQELTMWLKDEGANLLYYIESPDGQVLSNTAEPLWQQASGQVALPEGYAYELHFDGQNLTAYDQTSGVIDLKRLDSGYDFCRQDYWDDSPYPYVKAHPSLANCKIVLAVKSELVPNPYGNSNLYGVISQIKLLRGIFYASGILAAAAVLLLVGGFFKREDKRRFDRRLAELSGHLWCEVKLMLGMFLAMGMVAGFYAIDTSGSYFWGQVVYLLITLACAWGIYLLLVDLWCNRYSFFTHNMITSLLKLMRSREQLKPFQEKMLSRFYFLVGAEIFLVLTAVITVMTVIIPMLAVGLGIFLLLQYLRQYKQSVEDIGKVCDQIERIKAGDMETELILAPEAALYGAASSLNSIQEGVFAATEQKMKSERMKIDLVTNVSHDLKTPLTSIISYVDLLSKEETLSPEAEDYVRILRQKSDRLKALINDLFDLSKATSNSMDVTLERIDFAKLFHQVEADMAEEIAHSELVFKVHIADEPVVIMSDGGKMHRVLENLLTNAIKYALPGSRVYVDLKVADGQAKATIKNTAKYEMDFDAETILGRFVRGDKARATEGSGIGLAIAQSYTEACGGQFNLTIDGDLFKVEVIFALEPPLAV